MDGIHTNDDAARYLEALDDIGRYDDMVLGAERPPHAVPADVEQDISHAVERGLYGLEALEDDPMVDVTYDGAVHVHDHERDAAADLPLVDLPYLVIGYNGASDPDPDLLFDARSQIDSFLQRHYYLWGTATTSIYREDGRTFVHDEERHPHEIHEASSLTVSITGNGVPELAVTEISYD